MILIEKRMAAGGKDMVVLSDNWNGDHVAVFDKYSIFVAIQINLQSYYGDVNHRPEKTLVSDWRYLAFKDAQALRCVKA